MAVFVDLADLLTASGNAMATSNERLRAGRAPALLQRFDLTLGFSAAVCVAPGDATLLFQRVSRQNPQMTALFPRMRSNVTVNATYIAAPGLVPVPPT